MHTYMTTEYNIIFKTDSSGAFFFGSAKRTCNDWSANRNCILNQIGFCLSSNWLFLLFLEKVEVSTLSIPFRAKKSSRANHRQRQRCLTKQRQMILKWLVKESISRGNQYQIGFHSYESINLHVSYVSVFFCVLSLLLYWKSFSVSNICNPQTTCGVSINHCVSRFTTATECAHSVCLKHHDDRKIDSAKWEE